MGSTDLRGRRGTATAVAGLVAVWAVAQIIRVALPVDGADSFRSAPSRVPAVGWLSLGQHSREHPRATPLTRYLMSMNAARVDGVLFQGVAAFHGRSFPHSVWLPGGCNVADSATYDLGGVWARLDTTLGINADSPSAAPTSFRIFGDGALIFQATVPPGGARPVSVRVTGVQHLQISAKAAPCGARPHWVAPVFGSARLALVTR